MGMIRITPAEKTFAVVFIFGSILFVYYFFIVPPEPVYYEYDPQAPPPRNAIHDLETGELIVGYKYPSVIYVVPPVLFFYFVLMLVTDNGYYRLREVVDLKAELKQIKKDFYKKIHEGKIEYKKWKNK